MRMQEHATAVLLITPQGVVMVKDPTKPTPRYLKLPGGKGNPGEDPRDCAARETEEETGARVPRDSLRMMLSADRGTHIFTMYYVIIPELPQLRVWGNDGEFVDVVPTRELFRMKDQILPEHRVILGKLRQLQKEKKIA